MDLTKDSNFNPLHPGDTPCRWTGNISHCKDESFFHIIAIISLSISLINIPLGILLITLARAKKEKVCSPRTWSAPICFYFASVSCGVVLSINDAVLLFDPPSPYWLRHTLGALPFVLILMGKVPYLHTLTQSNRMAGPTLRDPIPSYLPLRISMRLIPPLLIIHTLGIFVRGLFMDLGKPMLTDVFTIVAQTIIGVICLIMSCTCLVYGCSFAMALRQSIQVMEEGLRHLNTSRFAFISHSRSHKSPGATTAAEELTEHKSRWFLRSAKDLFASSSNSQVGHGTSSHGTQSNGTYSSIASNSSPPRTLTSIEAKAVLQKITFLNLFLASSNFLASVGCLLLGAMPSSVFTIPLLSKILCFLLLIAIPSELQMAMLCNLYTEVRRRRMKSDFHAQSSSLVSQAIRIRQKVLARATDPSSAKTSSSSSPSQYMTPTQL